MFDLPEVILLLNESKKRKDPGPDGVPLDLFTDNIDFWAPSLTNVFNTAARSGPLPSWGLSVIVPIFKKGDRSNVECYRPISLIDSTIKVMGAFYYTD